MQGYEDLYYLKNQKTFLVGAHINHCITQTAPRIFTLDAFAHKCISDSVFEIPVMGTAKLFTTCVTYVLVNMSVFNPKERGVSSVCILVAQFPLNVFPC